MPSQDNHLSRHDFLNLVIKGSLALSGLLGFRMLLHFLEFQDEAATPTHFDIGLADDYPLGARSLIPQARAIVLHNDQGLIALSLDCPHLGCMIN